MDFFQAMDALLDVLDATSNVVALMAVWYTWIAPRRKMCAEDESVDVDRFMQEVAAANAVKRG